jgi:hypothetical protein
VTNLGKLQAAFQEFILNDDPAVRAEIVGTERVDAQTRLGIYANAYRLRLLEALDTDYPGLHRIAGDEEFERMGRAYIDTHPSTFRSLRWFGDRMNEFLQNTPPWRDYPVFAEMAAFEWAMSDAFDAADARPASVEHMATVAPDAWPVLRFTAHDSLRRLDLRWNVPTVWKAIDAGHEPPALEEAEHPVAWLIWRRDLRTYFRSLDVAEAWALDAMLAGETFSGICEGLTEWIDATNVPMHAAGLLKRWLADGLIRTVLKA